MSAFDTALEVLRERYILCVANAEITSRQVNVSGWVTPRGGAGEILVEGGRVLETKSRLNRPGVVEIFKDSDFMQSGFSVSIEHDPDQAASLYIDHVVKVAPAQESLSAEQRICNTWIIPCGGDYVVPPSENVTRVTGKGSYSSFLFGGATHAWRLVNAMKLVSGRSSESFSRVIDWGCGALRLGQHLRHHFLGNVHGVDVDPVNVEWCERNIPQIPVRKISWTTPTEIPDASYDLLFAYSVFSHISTKALDDWIEEVARVLDVRGIALITTLGVVATAFRKADAKFFEKFETEGYVEWGNHGQLDDVRPTEESYLNIAMTKDYAYRKFSKHFKVLGVVEGVGPQDVWVLEKL